MKMTLGESKAEIIKKTRLPNKEEGLIRLKNKNT